MWTWLNESQVGAAVFSWVKVFVATVLALFLADGADVFNITVNDAKAWVAAGVAAVVPIIINALNPADGRYGRGAE